MASIADPVRRVDGGILGRSRATSCGTTSVTRWVTALVVTLAIAVGGGQRKTRRTLRDAARAVWQASRPIGDHVAPPG